eukprot:5188454-Karenia_brevis.AAC.1
MASSALFDASLSYGAHGEVFGPPPGIFGCYQPPSADALLDLVKKPQTIANDLIRTMACALT